MLTQNESQERRVPTWERAEALVRRGWRWTRTRTLWASQKFLACFDFLQLHRKARALRTEIDSHCRYVGQVVVRLHREAGHESVFESFGEIKSEIEAITRRQEKLRKLAVQIAEARTDIQHGPEREV